MRVISAVLALALVACAFAANTIYLPTDLTSGVPYLLAQATAADTTRCSYYKLVVPAGTGAVQVDLTSPSDAYSWLSVTAGFNYYPRADRDTSTSGYSFLFNDNNIPIGGTGSYILCTSDPVTGYNAYSSASTSSSKDSGYCAAFVPNMHLGGTVFICLSAYSESLTGRYIGIKITMTSKPLTVVTGDKQLTWTILGNTAGGVVNPYKIFIPSNVTSHSWTTGSQSIVSVYGLGNSATRTFGEVNADNYFYAHHISKSSAQNTATYNPTVSLCDNVNNFPVTSNLYCTPLKDILPGVQTNATFTKITSGSSQYAAFRLTVPTPAATATGQLFYSLNITTAPNNYGMLTYVSGSSWNGIDNSVGRNMQLAYTNSLTRQTDVPYSWVARYLVPGSSVQVVFYSFGNVPTGTQMPFTATFSQETSQNLVIGSTVIGDTTLTTTVATPAPTNINYYIACPLTTTGTNGYTVTVSSAGGSIGGVQIVSKDFKTVIAAIGSTSGTTFNFNVPSTFLPTGTYNILVVPYTSGTRTITFTVEKTIGSTAAGVYPSIAVMIVALIAMLFF